MCQLSVIEDLLQQQVSFQAMEQWSSSLSEKMMGVQMAR